MDSRSDPGPSRIPNRQTFSPIADILDNEYDENNLLEADIFEADLRLEDFAQDDFLSNDGIHSEESQDKGKQVERQSGDRGSNQPGGSNSIVHASNKSGTLSGSQSSLQGPLAALHSAWSWSNRAANASNISNPTGGASRMLNRSTDVSIPNPSAGSNKITITLDPVGNAPIASTNLSHQRHSGVSNASNPLAGIISKADSQEDGISSILTGVAGISSSQEDNISPNPLVDSANTSDSQEGDIFDSLARNQELQAAVRSVIQHELRSARYSIETLQQSIDNVQQSYQTQHDAMQPILDRLARIAEDQDTFVQALLSGHDARRIWQDDVIEAQNVLNANQEDIANQLNRSTNLQQEIDRDLDAMRQIIQHLERESLAIQDHLHRVSRCIEINFHVINDRLELIYSSNISLEEFVGLLEDFYFLVVEKWRNFRLFFLPWRWGRAVGGLNDSGNDRDNGGGDGRGGGEGDGEGHDGGHGRDPVPEGQGNEGQRDNRRPQSGGNRRNRRRDNDADVQRRARRHIHRTKRVLLKLLIAAVFYIVIWPTCRNIMTGHRPGHEEGFSHHGAPHAVFAGPGTRSWTSEGRTRRGGWLAEPYLLAAFAAADDAALLSKLAEQSVDRVSACARLAEGSAGHDSDPEGRCALARQTVTNVAERAEVLRRSMDWVFGEKWWSKVGPGGAAGLGRGVGPLGGGSQAGGSGGAREDDASK